MTSREPRHLTLELPGIDIPTLVTVAGMSAHPDGDIEYSPDITPVVVVGMCQDICCLERLATKLADYASNTTTVGAFLLTTMSSDRRALRDGELPVLSAGQWRAVSQLLEAIAEQRHEVEKDSPAAMALLEDRITVKHDELADTAAHLAVQRAELTARIRAGRMNLGPMLNMLVASEAELRAHVAELEDIHEENNARMEAYNAHHAVTMRMRALADAIKATVVEKGFEP